MNRDPQPASSWAQAFFAPLSRDPDAPFAVGDDPRTWGQLLSDVEALAEVLAGQPVAPSREVIVACGDRYFGTASLLAIWRAGLVAALPPNGRKETIDALAVARGISLILHDGGGEGPLALDVRGVLGRTTRPGVAPRLPFEQTIACVYTSGSRGAPVACLKTAGQLLGEAAVLAQAFDLGPGTRVLATVPPLHIYGLLFGTLVPLMAGGVIVRATPFHAETIAAAVRACGADVLCTVPAHLRGLAELSVGALPGLRRVFSSAAPLDVETAKRVAAVVGRGVTEIFGSTETGGIAWRDGTADPGWQPLPGVEVTAGVDQTILVRSPMLSAAPYEGADKIRLLPGGRFELVGRADGILKMGGIRVSVAEVEQLLRVAPGVGDAAVLSVAVGGARGHELWAAVAPASLDVAALRAHLLRHLDGVAVPRRFRVVASLPREENGKLTRERLEALFGSRVPSAASPSEPPRERYTDVVRVPSDWAYFEGHFEGFPILAGVVQMTEIILPAVAAHWRELQRPRHVTNLKFRRPINPGDALELEITRTAPLKVTFALHRQSEVMTSGALEFAAGPP
jgi:4-coumarate--CoA ligase (photoactive yellow protein activation family)